MMFSLDCHSINIVRQCLRAASEGPFFPEWEFETLFGVRREVVTEVLKHWPDQTVDDESYCAAIVGSMNNILGYPSSNKEFDKYIESSTEEIRRVIEYITR